MKLKLKCFLSSGWGADQMFSNGSTHSPSKLLYSVREAAPLKACQDVWADLNVNIALDYKVRHKWPAYRTQRYSIGFSI